MFGCCDLEDVLRGTTKKLASGRDQHPVQEMLRGPVSRSLILTVQGRRRASWQRFSDDDSAKSFSSVSINVYSLDMVATGLSMPQLVGEISAL